MFDGVSVMVGWPHTFVRIEARRVFEYEVMSRG
jgi:hypothetical protein